MNENCIYGIGVDENSMLFCSDKPEEIDACWNGITEISDWIINNYPNNDTQQKDYQTALSAVECFNSWNKNINGNTKKRIPSKVLNEIFKPAVLYIRKYRNMKQIVAIGEIMKRVILLNVINFQN